MRLLTKKDEEMYRTIKLSIKMSAKDKMSEYFKKQAQEKKTADAWFYNGLNAFVWMESVVHTQKKHEYLTEAITSFEKACDIEEKHWPSLYMRSMIITMMYSDDVEEMCIYLLPTDYTLDDANDDRENMIKWQEQLDPKPYFFIPYAATAHCMLVADDTKKAKEYIKKGLTTTPAGKITSLNAFLFIPVIVLYNKLMEMKMKKAAFFIKKRLNIMFPSRRIK